MSEKLSFPGFIDVHVHFRDPGIPEAETTVSGLKAAERGGFGAVVTMPNTSPACDSVELLNYQRSFDSPVLLFPSACITKGRLGRELTELERLAEAGAALFTDDGSYVESDKLMEEAMARAAKLDFCVADHALDHRIVGPGVIRDCQLAKKCNLPIIPALAEIEAIKRDIAICRVTGCKLHIQHISTAEGVDLVRDAQKEGLPVTAEATPHHLLFACDELIADDANYKMAPPLGNKEDRFELRKAVKEGVLMFATDHAPHPASKKTIGFLKSANGITGLEIAIASTYTVMVLEEGMDIDAWAKAWWEKPRKVLSQASLERLNKVNPTTNILIGERRAYDLSSSQSLSRNCPYDKMIFDGWPC